MAKLVILDIFLISFILALRATVVAKLVILGIAFSFLASFILALSVLLVGDLVISGILTLAFLILALYTFVNNIKGETVIQECFRTFATASLLG